jgi:diguanylate cyclase (GGDEF)-like protein
MDRRGARIHALEEEGRNLPGEGREIGVAFIDLDNFKQINDSAGHHVGDQVLNIAVSRMQGLLHEEDLLGRLGGDEFALLVNRPMREQEMFQYMEELRKALEHPVELGNYVFSISGSFGGAVYPQDGRSVTDLLKCADTAMYKAKESGRNVIRFFDRQMEEEIRERMEMESLLVNAIEREEIHLVYQPQFQTSTLQIRGVEALARWQSAELGNIPPDKFIPLAEAQGHILPLGKWVLRNACMDMRRLQEDLGRRFILAVNISAAQIYHPCLWTWCARCSRKRDIRRNGWSWRSRSPWSSPRSSPWCGIWTPCARWGSASRWTISARASPPCTICRSCRLTS